MYQFYYANTNSELKREECTDNIRHHFNISAIRPTMWEEHCLECSAPLCFDSCMHYSPRSDGRCKRFDNGLLTFQDEKACCGQGVRIKFRQWGNMMSIVFPAMLNEHEYENLFNKNEKFGRFLKKIESSFLPRPIRWQSIRIPEFLRRKKLRNLKTENNIADAFLFHGYSYSDFSYKLILEIYNDHTSVFKTSINIHSGENIKVLSNISDECSKSDNLIKIYPENNLESELDILWCDFVQGTPIVNEKPAEKVKCVVWDLDGTLWDGTLIETDDTNTLSLKQGILETIISLDERGIIQSVASKNDYKAAILVIERLGLDKYFIYPQISWNPKSDSLEAIAKNLNIGIDSLAFVDDTIFERKQVNDVWPQIRTYDASEALELLSKKEFDVPITNESRNRRAMYKAEEKRNALQSEQKADIVSFLKKCNLRISVFSPQTDEQILRCYELVVRTNQLNMCGTKYTKEEFEQILHRDKHINFAVSCADDFGEYGIIAFGQYTIDNGSLIFKEFAMSCRVAGKFVESSLFTHLLKTENCKIGDFTVQKTKKNILLRNTLENIGFVTKEHNDVQIKYSLDLNLSNSDIVKVI